LTSSEEVVRSPHLALAWSGEQLLLTDGLTGNVFAVTPPVLRTLGLADRPVEPERLAETAAVSRAVVASLVEAGLLVTPDELRPPDHWSTYELIVQRMAGGGGARAGGDPDAAPPMRKGSWSGSVIGLPRDARLPAADFAAVLLGRRSQRGFAPRPLELADLAAVLVGAAGLQRSIAADGTSLRPHASAGGRHPLEITVVASAVRGLERGVYWFDAFDATLHEQDVDLEVLDELHRELGGSLGLGRPCEPPVVLLVTAVFARTLWKYDGIGLGLVYRDAGCLLQTLHLAATALGLAACPAHLRGELAFSRWLGLDPIEESLVGAFAMGRPAPTGSPDNTG
jgi:SagB-type dehydrogenase family enzyme